MTTCQRLAAALSIALAAVPASAQGPTPAASRYRLIRSTSGPQGVERGGRYLIEDPRSVFSLAEDKQVVVYFELEGPTGEHVLQGSWRDPRGRLALQSSMTVKGNQLRFGGYWTLLISKQLEAGQWTIELSVDGEPSGSHSVQVQRGPRGANSGAQRVLGAREVDERARSSCAFVEALDATGQRLRRGSGFFMGGRLHTAFQVIDGASGLRVTMPDGRQIATGELLAWSRWEDWAIVHLPEGNPPPSLSKAPANSWSVGDPGFSVSPGEDGNRVIGEVAVAGRSTHPRAGERMRFNAAFGRDAAGAPVLNAYGEVIAVLGGSTVPGDTAGTSAFVLSRATPPTLQGTPIELVRAPEDARATPLGQLLSTGDFLPQLTGSAYVRRGSLGSELDPQSTAVAFYENYQFAQGGQMTVSVVWDPTVDAKAETLVRLYDLDGRTLAASKPAKLGSKALISTWQIPLAGRAAGAYRVDVFLGDQPVWRAFFRVKD